MTQVLRLYTKALLALAFVAVTALPLKAAPVDQVVSPGGIKAWLIQDHSNPIISVHLAFRGGASLDPEGKAGLASMVSSTIDEGAGELDSQAFQGLLDNLSISLSFSAGYDNFQGSLLTLTENRDAAFRLLRLALNEPRFDEEPVERIRAQILTGLTRQQEDPDAIVGRTIRRLLFPQDPYGRPANGSLASVPRITGDDLRGFVKERFGRDQLFVAVVGDVTPEELGTLLDSTFMVLPEKAAPMVLHDTDVRADGGLLVVEKDIPQSVVAFGHSGIKRDDPDYYAAYVVNYILGGGGFSSRLYEEVREKRGLAYSVYSYLNPLDRAALVMGGVATQNARVVESLDLIRAEWQRIGTEGPTAEELAHAKRYLTGSFPLRMSSSGRISRILLGIQIEDLGSDYLEKRNSFIEAVSLEDAKRVATRLYNAEALTTVVVGKPADLSSTLEPPKDPG